MTAPHVAPAKAGTQHSCTESINCVRGALPPTFRVLRSESQSSGPKSRVGASMYRYGRKPCTNAHTLLPAVLHEGEEMECLATGHRHHQGHLILQPVERRRDLTDDSPASVTPNMRMIGVTPSSDRASACAGPIA